MKLSEFDYHLPKELIAQYPVRKREKCQLMVLVRRHKKIKHRIFEDIVEYFNEGDCLVLNDTEVIPARLFGKRETGGRVEIFLLDTKSNPVCEALVESSGRLKEGEIIKLESGDEAEILHNGGSGRFIRFFRCVDDIINECGHIPLPPYIDREDEESDRYDYQTVYAEKKGATASPTAGLHFTNSLLEKIKERKVNVCYITLHTSYGTFAPIKTENIEEHKMHKEYFELPEETARIINDTKKKGNKIFAVGTTSMRVLEHSAERLSALTYQPSTSSGYTDLFIYPGYGFKVVDCLITNFHLPKSTLLLLVSAFAGKDFVFEAYRQAIEQKYRFFSYGDAMLVV